MFLINFIQGSQSEPLRHVRAALWQHLPFRTRVHHITQLGIVTATEKICYFPPPVEAGDIPSEL
jgi:hypothetical protein